MKKIIIGCDPDSKASGIAVYKNGKLDKLECMPLIEIMHLFKDLAMYDPKAELHIENVNGKSASFSSMKVKSLSAKLKIAQDVGACKQVQYEVELIAKNFGIEVVRHPISSAWKKGASKSQFKLITKWHKPGNEDSRSAAYFGWLGTRV
tara:strand:- start:3 stop:449 length:447 start_codon:yes stop_codon:yes gene_type:complete